MSLIGSSSKNTTNQTTNNYDQRQVNTTSDSFNTLLTFSTSDSNDYLSSNSNNTSSLTNTTYSNSGNTSNLSNTSTTNNYDASVKNNITNYALTDGGAISSAVILASKALDINQMSSVNAYDFADNIFSSALDFANSGEQRQMQAYDRAAMIQGDAIDQLQSAYADAKGTTDSQKKIIYAVLAVAGVAVIAAINK